MSSALASSEFIQLRGDILSVSILRQTHLETTEKGYSEVPK